MELAFILCPEVTVKHCAWHNTVATLPIHARIHRDSDGGVENSLEQVPPVQPSKEHLDQILADKDVMTQPVGCVG